jgi:GNAT superfamily N-acetyltransferase
LVRCQGRPRVPYGDRQAHPPGHGPRRGYPGETDLLGGLLFSAQPPTYPVQWLVISEHARRWGIGRPLMTEMTRQFPPGPAIVEVVTFGTDHPGAAASGARAFYERLGFTPAEAAAPGPEGGSRQVHRKTITCPEAPASS